MIKGGCELQRYFVRPEQIDEDQVTISGDDAHHMVRVMRSKPGDTVVICDNSGKEFTVRLVEVGGGTVRGHIVSVQKAESEPLLRITLAQSLLKGDKLEWVVQKGTEMGVHAFYPFRSKRSVVKLNGAKAEKRRDRWKKVGKEAAEQSHRARVPEISVPIDWEDLLRLIASFDVAIIPYEREHTQSLSGLWQTLPQVETCLIIIGPEGGFDEVEVDAARQAGAHPVHLGPRILRAETAALTTIACTMWACGEMEGTSV